ncbi:MAG TPA: hypothetical protein VHU40_12800, partial [Polyangia bacterium]|nr:hypothetical protein [Polyangia bacterium]
LVEVSGEASNTIVFPVPIDLTGMATSAATGTSPALTQAMMQSATALAAQTKTRGQLGEAQQDPLASASSDAVENTFARRR